MALAFVTFLLLRYKARKNDEAWQVSIDELHFDDPIEVIGQGSFGVVLLAEYRGTRVAIKRAVKAKQKSGSRNASGRNASGTQPDMGSSIPSVPSCDEAASSNEENRDVESQVQKGDESKVSSRTGSRSGSRSGGGRAGSRSKSDNYFSLRFLHDEYGQSSINLFGCWGKKKKGYRARFRDSILGESLSGSLRSKTLQARLCPWFDEQTIRENEFLTEMRVLARLRHPCITTVMGKCLSAT